MILDRFRLDDQVAVVTGGTRGIGKGIALGFAQAGAHVAVVSRKPAPDIQEAVENLGRRYLHLSVDLTSREQTCGVVSAVCEAMGDIHILVNNSGIIPRSPADQFPESDWDATLEIDLTAAFILSRDAGQRMLNRGSGKIINIASVLAFQGGLYVAAYAAAKHGVTGLTKSLANEWAEKGINVNAIAPGYFTTDLTAALQNDPDRSGAILGRIPANRWGDPDTDIAGAAVFLASAASDYIHGSVVTVDGGWLAR
jgi:2-dehydro-3-deoxy-D-gluconate 5-dehydrogenase